MAIPNLWISILEHIRGINRLSKVVIIASTDFLLLNLVVFFSYMLRLSAFELPPTNKITLYIVAPVLSVVCMFGAGIYSHVSRSVSASNEWRLLLSQIVVLPLWGLVLLSSDLFGFSRSVIIIYLILAVLALVLIRRMAASIFSARRYSGPIRDRIPVIIYGAGKEGTLLVDALNLQRRYRPVAFLESDHTLVGRKMNGLPIKSFDDYAKVIAKYSAQEVLIAKPSETLVARRAIVQKFLDLGMQVKTVPNIDDIVDGSIDVNSIRPIKLEDLLGREPIPPQQELMESAIKGKVVLVTGAGGSIGSELVRQVVAYDPSCIVLLDSNEFALFEIHRETEARVASANDAPKLLAVLANVLDAQMIDRVISEQGVNVVFHAAAYKHVRMVQENANIGIRNNVWGTLNVSQAAMRNNVQLLVLISTDKAVRPTSIMGASKRVAEMVVQALARETRESQIFAMVRFGNVLGSTGSVVPLFQEQISSGGPVKITHREVTRYFMLIPEAAQLVIQAGALANRGQVFVLDMGEPVKIIKLAETMIELAGMTVKSEENPQGDIALEFVGLREGEKLFEELQIGRDVSSTSHARIMRSNEFYLPWKELKSSLIKLERLLDSEDNKNAVQLLMNLAQMGANIDLES